MDRVASVDIDNNVLFERVECEEPNHEFVSEFICEMKPIAPNVFKIHALFQTRTPLKKVWVQSTLYHRYSTYQRFVHLWENLCEPQLKGKTASKFNIIVDNLSKLGNLTYDYKCPFTGIGYTNERLNMSQFIIPLAPAGRYRLDLELSLEKDGKTSL